eukprot:NODE_6738_length_849_cov_26.891185_g6140_i0.p1 GENE.NODE_6738_length_849_cov_26.891185_g6140_i0~~NODE_6738_length_849_cov_26.891185_g6140_i0.p1  ORF type:complete len:215 (-),score=53.74 NODE_6738_length_849_cov_26.891185_g6140_i0:144-788(-)
MPVVTKLPNKSRTVKRSAREAELREEKNKEVEIKPEEKKRTSHLVEKKHDDEYTKERQEWKQLRKVENPKLQVLLPDGKSSLKRPRENETSTKEKDNAIPQRPSAMKKPKIEEPNDTIIRSTSKNIKQNRKIEEFFNDNEYLDEDEEDSEFEEEDEYENAGEILEEIKPEVTAPVIPRGWDCRVNLRTGRLYYVDHINKVTSWELPLKTTKKTN